MQESSVLLWSLIAFPSLALGAWGKLLPFAAFGLLLVFLCVGGVTMAPNGHPDFWKTQAGWDHLLGVSALNVMALGPTALVVGGVAGTAVRLSVMQARRKRVKKEVNDG